MPINLDGLSLEQYCEPLETRTVNAAAMRTDGNQSGRRKIEPYARVASGQADPRDAFER